MFRLIKVEGESMQPRYQPGDYVLVCRAPIFCIPIKPGDTVVFNQPPYGILIKQVSELDPATGEMMVTGLQPESVDSRHFGPVPAHKLLGKVVGHIPRSR